MKKSCFWVWILILLFGILPAAANPIYVPPKEGDVYRKHIDVGIFAVAAEEGSVTGWKWDLQKVYISEQAKPIPNGTEVVVDSLVCLYGMDSCWADPLSMRLPWENDFGYSGFKDYDFTVIPMEELVPVYDSADFIEQHEAEILPFDENFDFCAFLPFVVRSYPNSLINLKTIDSSFSAFKRCPLDEDYYRKYYAADRVYIDENGSRWVTFEWEGNFGKGWVNIGAAAE